MCQIKINVLGVIGVSKCDQLQALCQKHIHTHDHTFVHTEN